jgi:hypothetical protein
MKVKRAVGCGALKSIKEVAEIKECLSIEDRGKELPQQY